MGRSRSLAGALLLCSSTAAGQAWTGQAGEGSVALVYQNVANTGHLADDGATVPLGGSHTQSVTVLAEYAVTSRLSAQLALSWVAARNGGDPSPVLGQSGIDDGRYHSTIQDFRFGARYRLLSEPFLLTPLVEAVVPSHSYETRGEAAPGRNLKEIAFGLWVGRTLAPLLPNAYLQGRYAYAFVERAVSSVGVDRSNATLQLGYFVTPSLSASVVAYWQRTHGGVVFPDEVLHDEELFLEHDRMLADRSWKLGGSVAYAVTPALELFVSGYRTLSGANTHIASGMTFGAAFSFATR